MVRGISGCALCGMFACAARGAASRLVGSRGPLALASECPWLRFRGCHALRKAACAPVLRWAEGEVLIDYCV